MFAAVVSCVRGGRQESGQQFFFLHCFFGGGDSGRRSGTQHVEIQVRARLVKSFYAEVRHEELSTSLKYIPGIHILSQNISASR